MKIQHEEKEYKKVEGYIDEKKRVFIVTNDNGLLENNSAIERSEKPINYDEVGSYLKKYKPKFLTHGEAK